MENFINSLLDDAQGGAGTAILLITGLIILFIVIATKSYLKGFITENLKPFISGKIESYKQDRQQRKIRQAYELVQADLKNKKIALNNDAWGVLTQHYMK